MALLPYKMREQFLTIFFVPLLDTIYRPLRASMIFYKVPNYIIYWRERYYTCHIIINTKIENH